MCVCVCLSLSHTHARALTATRGSTFRVIADVNLWMWNPLAAVRWYISEKRLFFSYHCVTVSFSYLCCNSLTIFQPAGESLSKLTGLRDKSLLWFISRQDRVSPALSSPYKDRKKNADIRFFNKDRFWILSLHINSDDVSVNTVTLKKSFNHIIISPFLFQNGFLRLWLALVKKTVIVFVTIMRNHILSLFIMQSFKGLFPQNLVGLMEDKLREKKCQRLDKVLVQHFTQEQHLAFNYCSKTSSHNINGWTIYQTDVIISTNTWDQQSWELRLTGSTPWIPPLVPCIIIITTRGLVLVRPLSPECFLGSCPMLPRDGVNAQS